MLFRSGLLDFALFKEIVEEARKLGAIAISLNGGEPTLHPNIVDMLEISTKNFRTDIFTNATKITEEFCKSILNLSIDKFFISLDGFEKHHDKVRGDGNYQKTLEGIRLLKKNGFRVWINSILHQENEDELPQFQKFCMETLKVNGMKFVPVNPIGNAKQNMEMFKYPEKTRNSLVEFPNAVEDSHPMRKSNILKCRAGLGTIYITAKGEVYPCNYFRRAAFCIGNINQNKLSELYLAHLKKDSIFTNFDESKLESCKGCPALKSCAGGCRARALVFTGDVYGKDPLSCATRGFLKSI